MPDILTKREVEETKAVSKSNVTIKALATIEAMVGLLEQVLYAHNADLKKQANIAVARMVATYHGTKGGDDAKQDR